MLPPFLRGKNLATKKISSSSCWSPITDEHLFNIELKYQSLGHVFICNWWAVGWFFSNQVPFFLWLPQKQSLTFHFGKMSSCIWLCDNDSFIIQATNNCTWWIILFYFSRWQIALNYCLLTDFILILYKK